MQKADPSITLYACGAPVLWGRDWNLTLFKQDADILTRTTDHPLVGGDVASSTEPLDVYRDFMAVPDLLGRKWAQLRDDMEKAGIRNPRLAVTELQLFAHLQGRGGPLTRDTLVTPGTHAEALYDTLLYHRCIELLPFVDFVTQSATVNHGGGLRKERERVYPNPCHYAQSAFAAFNGATPLAVDVKCPAEKAPLVLPEVKPHGPLPEYPIISAVAARAADGALLVSLVHRGTTGPVKLAITLDGFAATEASLWQLSAEKPWYANTLALPKAVAPTESTAGITNNRLTIEIAPYTVVRLRMPPK
jgi:alpha-L-arabinofuranosidase